MPCGNLTSSPPSALTTTNPKPASAMMTITRMANETTTAAGLGSGTDGRTGKIVVAEVDSPRAGLP